MWKKFRGFQGTKSIQVIYLKVGSQILTQSAQTKGGNSPFIFCIVYTISEYIVQFGVSEYKRNNYKLKYAKDIKKSDY